jgi:lipopolysaccharide export system permease protein
VLALVIQMNLLHRSREQMALEAGGVSPFVFLRFIMCYGLLWACGQFFFSQFLGVAGDRLATDIWQTNVQGDKSSSVILENRWLTNGNRLIHFGSALPALKSGQDLLIYTLDDSGMGVEEILRAKDFSIEPDQWNLRNVVRLTPETFTSARLDSHILPIRQDIAELQFLTRGGLKGPQLPFWELDDTINRLEAAGSNVEALRTIWHGKLSYAASIILMGLLALVISGLIQNIYKAIGAALLVIFFVYCLNTFCATLGEKGLLAPAIGAWFADGLLSMLSLIWLFLPWMRRRRG